MTIEVLLKIGSSLAIVLSFALNLYLFFRSRADERFTQLSDRADRITKSLADEMAERRDQNSVLFREMAVLAATVSGMPTHSDLGDIRQDLSTLARTLASVNQRSETTLNSLNRIESYLLERRP